jgi:hypothetical protein
VDELSNVTGLQQYIFITKNDSITNLVGLHQICDTYLDFVTIVGNKSLSDCAAQCICEHLTGGGQYTINGNKTGCATREEIINQCLVPVVQPEYDPRFTLCPNPVHDQLQIHTSQNEDLTIFDVLGQPVRELNFTDTDKPVDVSTLPVGLYFIQLRESGMTIRFVKR